MYTFVTKQSGWQEYLQNIVHVRTCTLRYLTSHYRLEVSSKALTPHTVYRNACFKCADINLCICLLQNSFLSKLEVLKALQAILNQCYWKLLAICQASSETLLSTTLSGKMTPKDGLICCINCQTVNDQHTDLKTNRQITHTLCTPL